MNAPAKVVAAGPLVYQKIAAVQGELAKSGIAKDGQNTQQNYKFRGIDQVYGALSPLLAKHGLCVLPRIIDRQMHERVTVKVWNGEKKESVLFYVTVTAEFDFVAAEDGSVHTIRTYGEAMDSGDKATNKAMSAAYKYAAFMAFAIPTEGDNDADAHSPEVLASAPPVKPDEQITFVNGEQITRLQTLLEATKITPVQFCKGMKVKTVSCLPVERFPEAVERLEAKLADMAKAETNSLADEIGDDIPY